MVHNWGEKGTGRVWGLIKYAKNLLNYVFPQETSDCAVLFKMLLCWLGRKDLFCVWNNSLMVVMQAWLVSLTVLQTCVIGFSEPKGEYLFEFFLN